MTVTSTTDEAATLLTTLSNGPGQSSSSLSPLVSGVTLTAWMLYRNASSPGSVHDVTELNGWTPAPNATVNATVPDGCLVLPTAAFVPWDNPDNLVSLEVESTANMIISGFSTTLFFLLSFPTNVLNMAVFARHGLKERINACLFLQSLADLLFMTSLFLMYCDRPYLYITGGDRRQALITFFIKTNLIGLFAFSWVSGFLTSVIACERCLCVVSPLRARRILTTRTTVTVIAVASAVILSLAFVVANRWGVVCVYDPVTGRASQQLYPAKPFFLENKELINFIDGYIHGILYPFTFITTVTVATAVTVWQLKKRAVWREKTSSSDVSARDVALTRMLVGCSMLFVVCLTPNLVFRIAIVFVPDLALNGRYANLFNFAMYLTQLFGYVNASVNFFIYYRLGTKFRETLRALCVRGKRSRQTSNHPPLSSQPSTASHTRF